MEALGMKVISVGFIKLPARKKRYFTLNIYIIGLRLIPRR
jgi:hypothetical protein